MAPLFLPPAIFLPVESLPHFSNAQPAPFRRLTNPPQKAAPSHSQTNPLTLPPAQAALRKACRKTPLPARRSGFDPVPFELPVLASPVSKHQTVQYVCWSVVPDGFANRSHP